MILCRRAATAIAVRRDKRTSRRLAGESEGTSHAKLKLIHTLDGTENLRCA